MPELPDSSHPDSADSATHEHYRSLLAQSAAARKSGNHLQAQQLASAAHKWAMDEFVRVQRLTQAREELSQAAKQLEAAWDRDRSCGTLAELSERHPELRRVITRHETAEERLAALSTAAVTEPPATSAPATTRAWRGPRSGQPDL